MLVTADALQKELKCLTVALANRCRTGGLRLVPGFDKGTPSARDLFFIVSLVFPSPPLQMREAKILQVHGGL